MSDRETPDGRSPSIGLLQMLLDVRAQLLAGRPIWMFTNGGETVEHFKAFIEGFIRCLYLNGIPDDGYDDFLRWLREDKGELPPEGWARKYLRDCDGDHQKAILKYLDLLAEFAQLRGGTPPESKSG